MTDAEQPSPKKFMVPIELTKHPIVLLVVGAIVSNVVVPILTQKWQAQEKQLEVKTSIIQQIRTAVADIVSTTELIEVGTLSAEPQDSAEIFMTWSKSDALISSRLATYYPNTEADQKWQQFAQTVTNLYAFAIAPNRQQRALKLEDLKTELPQADIYWSILLDVNRRNPEDTQHRQYIAAWRTLKTLLFEQRDDFTQEILNSKSPSLSQ